MKGLKSYNLLGKLSSPAGNSRWVGCGGPIAEVTPEQFVVGVWIFPGRVHTTSNASVYTFRLKHCHENTVILMFYGVIQAHP